MNRASVQVLLSTYNGEKYINEQIKSIFNQKGVNIYCLIRDDGSVDNTRKILSILVNKYDNLKVIWGKNIGYEASFFELLSKAGDHDYYAFSDHDDVWLSGKIAAAVDAIENSNNDSQCLYFSNCTIVDAKLNRVGLLHSNSSFIPDSKIMGLVQGFAHGCTTVFTKKSKDLILKNKPQGNYAHDFWIPLIHLFLDKIIYDSNSYILYRQHTENVFGNKRPLLKLFKLRIKFFSNKPCYYSLLASEILNGFGHLLRYDDYNDLKKIVEYKTSFKNWTKLLFNSQIRKNTVRGTILLKILILFKRF